jgi:hypothetical protein
MGSFTRVVSPGSSSGRKPTGSGGAKKGPGGVKPANILIFALWGAAAIGVVTFAARKELVRVVAQNWLASQKVPSELKIDKLSFSHIAGSAKLGGIGTGPNVPADVHLKSFDVDYGLNLFAGKGSPLVRLKTIKLKGIDAQLAYKGGKLNFGALDPMVQKALKTPGKPEDAPESLSIEGLSVKLSSDYGLISAKGGVRMTRGQVESLDLQIPASVLHGPAGGGQINGASLRVTTLKIPGDGPRRHIEGHFDAQRFDINTTPAREGAKVTSDLSLESLRLSLNADMAPGQALLPSGPLKGRISLSAGTLKTADALVRGANGGIDFNGRFSQTAKQTGFDGHARLAASLERLRAAEIDARGLGLKGDDLIVHASLRAASPLVASLGGPLSLEAAQYTQGNALSLGQAALSFSQFALDLDGEGLGATFAAQGRTGRFAASDLSLNGVKLSLKGRAHADSAQVIDDSLGKPRDTWDADFTLDLTSANGSYTGLSVPEPARAPPEDAPVDTLVAIDNAARRFSLEVKGLSVHVAGSGPFDGHAEDLRVALASAARLKAANGGLIEISPVARQPLLSATENGAFDVSISGGDLPEVKASLRQVLMQAQSGAMSASYTINARFNQTPVTGGEIAASGMLVSRGGKTDITADDCVPFRADKAVLGSELTSLSGKICQGAEPLLRLEGGGWQASGVFTDFDADLPETPATLQHANGKFAARSLSGGGLAYEVRLNDAHLSDPLAMPRFNALRFAGSITQDAKALNGSFSVRLANESAYARNPKPVAVIDIAGVVATSSGHIGIHANEIDFTEAGLTPLDLSPTVKGVANPGEVTGGVRFEGFLDYGPETSTSGGTLKLQAIDFAGPLGTGKQLNSEIEFTSLTPLLSKPSQAVTLESFEAFLPFTKLKTALEFKGNVVTLDRSDGLSPGGTVVLEPMDVPLDDKGEIRGTLVFDGLDFGAVIKKTNLAKDVDFKGNLSGKVPFWIGPVEGVQRIRFRQGQLHNDGPGRLSLNPAVLTSVQGGGAEVAKQEGGKIEGGSLADPVGFYRQALSNIAFDEIIVDVNSTDAGVLQPKFHVKGRFDPPQKQVARIGLLDLLSGKWQSKTVDLPSDTAIDLTVETPINLDQIFDDLMREATPEKAPEKAPAT